MARPSSAKRRSAKPPRPKLPALATAPRRPRPRKLPRLLKPLLLRHLLLKPRPLRHLLPKLLLLPQHRKPLPLRPLMPDPMLG